MTTACLIYEDGRHFELPASMRSFFKNCSGHGRADFFLDAWHASTGDGLVRVDDPRRADFILFPYDIGWLVDALGVGESLAFLHRLPHFSRFESRHVLVDHGDSQSVVGTEALLFKVSLPCGFERPGVTQIWYRLPEHVAASGYAFSLEKTRYDISFVGTNTNRLRRLVLSMLERDRRLRTCFDLVEGEVRDGSFLASAPAGGADRQALFRRVTRDSLAVLCLPGIGPLSVRFFETLFFGRIPVVLQGFGRLPFQDTIDYDRFCIFIPRHELGDVGQALWSRLQARRSDFGRMCREACATWHRHFSEEALHRHMCRAIITFLSRPARTTAVREDA